MKSRRGIALISVVIFALVLAGFTAAWIEKSLFVFSLEETLVSLRSRFNECRSIASVLSDNSRGFFSGERSVEFSGELAWTVIKMVERGGNVKFRLNSAKGAGVFCQAVAALPPVP